VRRSHPLPDRVRPTLTDRGKTMRTALLFGLCGLFALGLLVAPAQADDKKPDDKAKDKAVEGKPQDLIIGKWTPTKEKDELTLEFTKDGKVNIKGKQGGKDLEINGTYKFDGDDKINVELNFGGQTKKDTLKVKVTKDELTTTDSMDKTDTFKRAK
jgi:uncharacterized protein (TIGR03066 family)